MLEKISPGIHAREWISPATATFLAKQLAEKKSALLASWDVYILPLANPDGYFTEMVMLMGKYELWLARILHPLKSDIL